MEHREPNRPKGWDGGSIHYGTDGLPHYSIDRVIGAVRYKISLHTTDIHAAREHYERFQRNPAAFSVHGEKPPPPAPPLHLTPKLAEDFLAWSREKGNTERWVRNQTRYLADWSEDLHGLDLRGGVNLRDHVVPALDRRKRCRQPRIAVLKAFFGWLRKERHELTSANDPTIDLPVPQTVPEKNRHRKIIPESDVLAAMGNLAPKTRDVLTLRLATAWHHSEVERFATEGEIVERPPGAHPAAWPEGVAAVLSVKQKAGGVERWSVSADALEAAKRVKTNGCVDERWINRSIAMACKAAGVPAFGAGALRHSVLTWARERGASMADISADLAHHKDPRTTRRFYVDVAVPRRLPTLV